MSASATRSSTAGAAPAARHLFSQTPSWMELAVVAAITLVAAAFRLHDLSVRPLWFDEGVSVAIARLDLYNFARLLWHREANMSLYYALLRPWLFVGQSEAAVRSLSVAFGVAAVPALYWLGRRLFDARVGLIAAALLCVHAYAIRYSQEARSYSLMLLLCVLSSLFFVESLDDPSRRNRIAYVAFSALAVYAHFFAGLLIVAQAASLWFLEDALGREAMRRAFYKVALAIAPIVLFVGTTGAGPLRWIPRPGFAELWRFALYLTGNAGVWLVLAFAVSAGAGLWPVWRERKQVRLAWDPWRYRFLLLWLGLPVIVVLAVSLIRPLFIPRYFVFCIPALLLLVACGLSRIRSKWFFAAALTAMLSLLIYGTVAYYRGNLDRQRDDWRTTTRYILEHSQPGDAIIFHVAMARMPFEYYRSQSGSDAPFVLYPNHGDQISYLDFFEKPDFARLQASLAEHPRVWVVFTYAETPSGPDSTARLLEQTLAGVYTNRQPRSFPGADVVLFSHAQ